jgi:hypothetical protein
MSLFSYRHIEYPSYVAVTVMEMNFERIDINQCPLGQYCGYFVQ